MKITLGGIMVTVLAMVMANAAGADEDDVMMTGTIVSVSGDELRIRTADVGEQTFKFRTGVERPANLTPGTEVTVWVDEDDADDNPAGEKVEKETYTIHRIAVAGSEPETRQAEPRTSMAEPRSPVTETEPDELPRTASMLPAMALAGLLALAAGLGFRLKGRRRP